MGGGGRKNEGGGVAVESEVQVSQQESGTTEGAEDAQGKGVASRTNTASFTASFTGTKVQNNTNTGTEEAPRS